MNQCVILGRLVKDVETRYTGEQLCISSFTVAVDRFSGKEKSADFIPVKVFGKQAESCEKYLAKGSQVAVSGSIKTSSYEKDGVKKYATEVIADKVEFLTPKSDTVKAEPQADIPSGFEYAQVNSEDIPF